MGFLSWLGNLVEFVPPYVQKLFILALLWYDAAGISLPIANISIPAPHAADTVINTILSVLTNSTVNLSGTALLIYASYLTILYLNAWTA